MFTAHNPCEGASRTNTYAERDRLMHDRQQTGDLFETYSISDFHKVRDGGGDPWHTYGGLSVGVISAR